MMRLLGRPRFALRRRTGRAPHDRDEPRTRRLRSLATTAALGSVLVALGGYTIIGTARTTLAAQHHGRALAVDASFSDARSAITLEEVHLRHYQVEPSSAVRNRFTRVADSVGPALRRAAEVDPIGASRDVRRLLIEQDAYRLLADQLLDLVADGDPRRGTVDRLELTPAYYTLQEDIDSVSRAYHIKAQGQAEDLRRAEIRMLIGTSVGFGIGLMLVAVIWRLVLSYQRRLVQHADASEHLALHDPVTGLPNRTMFHRRLTGAIEALASPDRQLALMMIDLNGFKAVNDTLGHHAGDNLLAEVGRRLKVSARDGDTVARLGGDEFAVLLPDIGDVDAACHIADRLAEALRHDFLLDVGLAAVSGSIGLAIGTMDHSAEALLRQADSAMYRAKSDGGGVAVYDPGIDAEEPDRMALFGELRALLDAGDPDGQLTLYFQPQVHIGTATVTAVEALVRWRHPARGLLMPDAFLSIAESRGLEIPLTYHLLDVAAEHAARWHASGRPMVVSVNVSPRCLLHSEFVPRVQAAVARSALPRSLLQLELTERSVMSEPERSRDVLRQIRNLGIKISIDDFGTGFSSLSQLKQLPADELKIDQSFVRGLPNDAEDVVLVRSAIDLAHNLGLTVVAEGVERLDALALLHELGCDLAQGFALSRPSPDENLLEACEQARRQTRAAPIRDRSAVTLKL
jgi:diguanylate cyclase (GGDEF)-like protein